ncbi:alpha/beta-hydrolase [Pleurotus eryngii]|uniref:Alpha/beta-hydrolase n=1 Tax=Pleurotus eryngii TaxID=5323 RepID=A0A9P6DCS1_PLEER|nr:alpha/beta-hydrolase [Pleurotus eryngii]
MDFDQPKFHRESVRIPSKTPGWDLDAWVYTPTLIATSTTVLSSTSESGGRTRRRASPVIVMAHGLGCTKSLGLSSYAEAFTTAGYACVAFDYRRWGDSDGTPRHCTYFQDQMDDYASVVKYCRQHEEFGFDPQRVILWGYSFSGGHVLSLSADPTLNIYATIAQAPYTGRAYNLSPTLLCLKRTLLALADIVLTTLSQNPVYIPTAAEPTDVGAVIAPGSTDGFRRLPGADRHFPNRINASTYLSAPSHQPREHVPSIQAPVLFVAAKQDLVCPAAKIIETSKRVLKAKVVEIPGNHFDMFEGGQAFEACREAQVKFLAQYVPL